MNAMTDLQVLREEVEPEIALAALRTVVARLKLIESEVIEIGLALKQGAISARLAIDLTEQVAPGCFGVVIATLGGK
jgi:hypothetical protein